MKSVSPPLFGLWLLLALPACKKPEVRVYEAPKEVFLVRATPPPLGAPIAAPRSDSHEPKLSYKAPPDWVEEKRTQVSLATFSIKKEQGEASVNITRMGDFSGREEMLVNMWRNQVGAKALSAEEAAKQLSETTVGQEKGHIFEVAGQNQGKPNRIITAMLNRPEGTWFFKLAGDDSVVSAEKPALLEFLKTVRLE